MAKSPKKRTKKSKPEVVDDVESDASENSEEAVEEQIDSDDESEKSEASVNDSEEDSESEDGNDGGDAMALFKQGNSSDEEESDEDSGSEDDDEAGEDETSSPLQIKGSENCTFDLRNMLAVNTHQLAHSSFYKSKKSSGETITIPLGDSDLKVNEDFLLAEASKSCTQLVHALWQLPTDRTEAGVMVQLPSYDGIKLPRALPPPPPKTETAWEKFAKAKGIPLNKEKRSRKVFDEATGEWMYRTGFEKANKKDKEWPIMEVGANDDPFDDPWEKIRDDKRARVDKNIESRMKNQERVGNLPKGATARAMKHREKSRADGRNGGSMDKGLPTGVPVDLKSTTGDAQKRGKVSTMAALEAVQRSTASLGRFDKLREGEPERRKVLSKAKKRKYELTTDKNVLSSEGEKSMKILNAVINGGGVAKEKAIRKGKFAKGETAYDYEYDDGLGASSFKKKKGRAGAGKMKKMTKKRVT